MPINLAIYGNVARPDIGNALQAYASGVQVRSQQQQNRLAAMQMEAAQRQQQQQDALNNAYKGNIGPDGQINYAGVQSALAGSGAGAQIPGVAKSAAEEQNLKLDQAAKVLNLQKSQASQVMAAPTLANAMASLDSMEAVTGKGSMDSERARLTAIGDNPEQIMTWAAGHALDADKILPHYSIVDTDGQVQTVGINPITGQTTQTGVIPKTMTPGQAAQIRQTAAGQAETARHNRVSEEIARNAPGITYQTDANGNLIALPTKAAPGVAPVGVSVTGADGRPVQGKAALTETQGNALGFGLRAKEAQKLLNGYESRGIGPQGIVDRTINGLPVIGNSLIGEDQQAYNQAKQNFISAVLRKESGAAISAGEFANEDKKYFPQPSDGPKVLAQKQAARDMAIQALEIQSGRKLPDASTKTKQTTSKQPAAHPDDINALLNKYGR